MATNETREFQEFATTEESDENDDCDCADLSGDFPCWECVRTGKREVPN